MIEVRLRGVKRFTAKNKKLSLYIRNQYAPEIVKLGLSKAKELAPIKTGALVSAIKGTDKKMSGKVYVIQPDDGGRNRPYHLWMHGIKAPVKGKGAGGGYDIASQIYSGDPHFMYTTRDYMMKQSEERFKKKIDSIY